MPAAFCQESQAKAQANIWLVLVGASSHLKDQLNAFSKAMNVLQAAQQPDVVEVRMQFADWLLRSGFSIADALAQLVAASDVLLEIEEGSEDEDEEELGGDANYYSGIADEGGGSDDGASSVAPSDWDKSQSNFGGSKRGSRAGSRMGSSRAGSMAGSKAGKSSKGSKSGSRAGSQSSRMSKAKKKKKGTASKRLGSLTFCQVFLMNCVWGDWQCGFASKTSWIPCNSLNEHYQIGLQIIVTSCPQLTRIEMS